jgi:hypothetical protein
MFGALPTQFHIAPLAGHLDQGWYSDTLSDHLIRKLCIADVCVERLTPWEAVRGSHRNGAYRNDRI